MKESAILFPMFLATALLAGCEDVTGPTGIEPPLMQANHGAPAPAPLVPVTAAGATQTLWPYTGTNFSGTPQDPINLIFVGESDPRSIRAALFALDGDRTAFGFPAAFPFNCTWKDAIGGVQTGYSEAAGWAGSTIQLECGSYDPIRFHIRLFDAGDWTVANAHLDVRIPGTPDHQVISWELAEQLVTADLVRSGLLAAAPVPTGMINDAPFREIPAIIYNGLPAELRQLAGGPLGNVTAPVPIQTDGSATILNLRKAVEGTPGKATQDFVIQFDQVIPKPFCNDGDDFVLVQGPVNLSLEVLLSDSGNLSSQVFARGDLLVTPIDPLTGTPLGAPQPAKISDHYRTLVTDHVHSAASSRMQQLQVPEGPPQQLRVDLKVGPDDLTSFSSSESCGA